jgi:uncharacterized membrane protein YidH (DUF202 family)
MTVLLFQPGLDEFGQAQHQLRSFFFPALDCAMVMAAILGIIGAVRIYHNWQMGERETTYQVSAWFFAALFVVVAGIFLRAVFGL